MKKNFLFAVGVTAVSILVTGCTGINTPPSGTMPNAIYTNTAAGIFVNTPVRPLVEKYKVINQHAVGEAVSTSYFGLVAVGDSTFSAAFDEILKNNEGADDVIDIKVDVRKDSVLLSIINTTLIVRGTAIKYLGERNNTSLQPKL